MRKWLFLLGAILVVYLISIVNSKKAQEKSPFLQRFKETITILAWTLTAMYVLAFLYWLFTSIF